MTLTTPLPAGSPIPASRDAARSAGSPPDGSARPLPHVPGVAHRFVTVRGVRLHVAEAGSGDPVLLLHGFPQHWYAWRRVIPLLSGQYRLICPDWRGFGWSQAPAHGYPWLTQRRLIPRLWRFWYTAFFEYPRIGRRGAALAVRPARHPGDHHAPPPRPAADDAHRDPGRRAGLDAAA